MDHLIYGLSVHIAYFQARHDFFIYMEQLQKFLKIQRVHSKRLQIPDWRRPDIFYFDPKKGTAQNIAETTVLYQKFDSCHNFRKFLDLIKK